MLIAPIIQTFVPGLPGAFLIVIVTIFNITVITNCIKTQMKQMSEAIELKKKQEQERAESTKKYLKSSVNILASVATHFGLGTPEQIKLATESISKVMDQ